MNRRHFTQSLTAAALFGVSASYADQPFVVDLAPPENRFSEALEYNDLQWGWTGGALTASTYWMRFDHAFSILDARVLLVWWPLQDAHIRFLYFDDGPDNLVGFHEHTEPDRAACCPVPRRFDVTQTFQSLAAFGTPKHIGFQCHGHQKLARVQLQMVFA